MGVSPFRSSFFAAAEKNKMIPDYYRAEVVMSSEKTDTTPFFFMIKRDLINSRSLITPVWSDPGLDVLGDNSCSKVGLPESWQIGKRYRLLVSGNADTGRNMVFPSSRELQSVTVKPEKNNQDRQPG